jgi:hypothetical protein
MNPMMISVAQIFPMFVLVIDVVVGMNALIFAEPEDPEAAHLERDVSF